MEEERDLSSYRGRDRFLVGELWVVMLGDQKKEGCVISDIF